MNHFGSFKSRSICFVSIILLGASILLIYSLHFTHDAEAVTGITSRVSTDSAGNQADMGGAGAAMSMDGRYIVLVSFSTNLVADDVNGETDVFVKDTQTGSTSLISVSSEEIQGNDDSGYIADISADGRYIVFFSGANNLVPGDTNNTSDVFLRDTVTGSTTRISTNSSNEEANYGGMNPSMSSDGQYIAFESAAANFVYGDANSASDVFLKDTLTGSVTAVSSDSAGNLGNAHSDRASLSADGQYVAFRSLASNLVEGDNNNKADIFLKNIETGSIDRLSTSSEGIEADDFSNAPFISEDGRYVTFYSMASNLYSGGSASPINIFLKDTQTGALTFVAPWGEVHWMNYDLLSSAPVSPDGRYVYFTSNSIYLVPGDTNNFSDVFVRDLLTENTKRLSVNASGFQGNEASSGPLVSSDNQFVALSSSATNLVADDTNGNHDVFLVQNTVSSDSQTSYYFPWYDSIGGRTWVLMAQPAEGSLAARDNSFNVFLKNSNGPSMDLLTTGGPLMVNRGQTQSLFQPGKMGGPVNVVSNEAEGLVSERSLFGNSFEEVWATAYSNLDSHYWWPVYDGASLGMKNWVLVSNPLENGENVTARVKIHGTAVNETRNLAPGETWTPIYGGVFGGPLEVKAWSQTGSEFSDFDSRKVIASQRVLYNGAFNELPGMAASRLRSSYIWTWYDNVGGSNWITLSNPSSSERIWGMVAVGNPNNPVFVDGDWIGPLQTRSFRQPGIGGPVFAFGYSETSDVPDVDIVATQRVIWGPSFGEIAGSTFDDLSYTTSTWTWYDQLTPGVTNWVLVSNLISEQIYTEIRIGGQTVWASTIDPYTNQTPTFAGRMGGPVEVEAWVSQIDPQSGQQTKQDPTIVFASQRVIWNGYFNEIVGKGM